MNEELIQPNLHIAIVHFPVALLVLGVLIEAFSFLGWRRSTLRGAARWMILLGAISLVPTATSGIYALHDVQQESSINATVREHLRDHIIFASIAGALALLSCTLWIGVSDRMRRNLHIPIVILLLAAGAAITVAAHVGGHMAYVHGLGVSSTPNADDRLDQQAPTRSVGIAGISEQIAPFVPPLQTHMILAGLAAALGVVSIGFSSRAMIDRSAPIEPVVRHDSDAIAAAFTKPLAEVVFAEERSTRAGPVVLLAVIAGALAALAGWWFAAHDSGIWKPGELWKYVTDRSLNEGRLLTRRTAHVVAGTSIVVLPLLLLAVSRFRPRGRVLWLGLSVLLLLAIAAQVWLGQLMLLDESRVMGPVTRWSTP